MEKKLYVTHEPTNFRCEFGHVVRKYTVNDEICHYLLCPRCDADEIRNLTPLEK